MTSERVRSLVVGGRGMLGIDLAAAIEADGSLCPVLAADLPELDITDEAALRAFVAERRPEVIFNCAAFTDVDGCESKRDLAFAVNGTGAGNVAAAAAAIDARMIHLSTDFIFDGAKRTPYVEDDQPAPLSAYGASKLEGERQVA